MKIITSKITLAELRGMLGNYYEDMVKAVVDITTGALALDGDMHADLEHLLVDNGYDYKNLWGINLFPDAGGEEFIIFDSLINIKPNQNNRGRYVEDAAIRQKIVAAVNEKVAR